MRIFRRRLGMGGLATAAAGFGAALTLLAPSSGATTFDTTPSWDGSAFISSWGPGGTQTYGETFIAPSDSTLQSFTFYLRSDSGTTTFQADVYAWSGNLKGGNSPQGATGPALFTSPNMSLTANGSFQTVTVNTGGVSLTPGHAYVALLTTSDPASILANTGSFQSWEWGDTQLTHVANDGGGGFNFYNNATSSELNTTSWDDFSDFGDLAWKAVFGPSVAVPEPTALSIILVGLAGLGFARRRKSV